MATPNPSLTHQETRDPQASDSNDATTAPRPEQLPAMVVGMNLNHVNGGRCSMDNPIRLKHHTCRTLSTPAGRRNQNYPLHCDSCSNSSSPVGPTASRSNRIRVSFYWNPGGSDDTRLPADAEDGGRRLDILTASNLPGLFFEQSRGWHAKIRDGTYAPCSLFLSAETDKERDGCVGMFIRARTSCWPAADADQIRCSRCSVAVVTHPVRRVPPCASPSASTSRI